MDGEHSKHSDIWHCCKLALVLAGQKILTLLLQRDSMAVSMVVAVLVVVAVAVAVPMAVAVRRQ